MKIYYLFLFLFISSFINAQTITSDWQLRSEHTQFFSTATNLNFFFEGEAGIDQVWDFSFLSISESTSERDIVDIDELTNDELAIGSTIGVITDENDEIYYLQNDTILELSGILRANGPQITTYPDPLKVMQFPLALGESFSDTYQANHVNSSGDTIQSNFFAVTTFLGVGELKLPIGDYSDVYLVRTVYPNSAIETRYAWYKGSLANKLLGFSAVPLDSPFSPIIYVQTNLNEVTAIQETNNIPWELSYSNHQFLSNHGHQKPDYLLRIINVEGKLIWQKDYQLHSGVSSISLPDLPTTGIYHLQVVETTLKQQQTLSFFYH